MRRIGWGLAVWWTAGAVLLLVGACRKSGEASDAEAGMAQALTLPSQAKSQTSASCRDCHAEQFEGWHGTDHAMANQRIEDADVAAAFNPTRTVEDGGSSFRVEQDENGTRMIAVSADGAEGNHYPVEGVLGQKPLRQMLVKTGKDDGRLQPVDMSWDVAHQEWFNVVADEGRREGEWGHWTGRGNNWNSMCAQCHMTGYEKNYDPIADRYASTWVEQGIGCIQCHGPVEPGHGTAAAKPKDTTNWIHDRQVSEQTCAYCHARNESLTAEFPPGALYEDHFRLTLPVQAGTFWPDGQQRDEDFNWTSVKLSRMHHAGVSCMDCHDPHTSETILPVENNALCMQCHSAPGRTMPKTGVLAPVIDPTAHSRHALGSTGNQCVSCHMPTTTYMKRAPRHDHGWLKPDPLLTKELGIPNACNGCHTEQSVDWAIAHSSAWYGDKLDSRQRARARAVASAQAGEESAVDLLLKLLGDEDIPSWRATYLQLLVGHADHDADVRTAAEIATRDADPMVRASAAQVLVGVAGAESVLTPLLDDPVRLVRLDAAWALPELVAGKPELAREQQAYFDLTLDQPGGRLRRGQFMANSGRLEEAIAEMALAAKWDRYSPGIHESHAWVLQAAGNLPQAAAAFYRAAQLQPEDGSAMLRAALAYAEAGLLAEAENALRAAVQRDDQLDRAWYNLGLLQVQSGRADEGLSSLAKAEALAPTVPDYAYAIATVYWQRGDREAARAAAARALAADPGYAPARQLLGAR